MELSFKMAEQSPSENLSPYSSDDKQQKLHDVAVHFARAQEDLLMKHQREREAILSKNGGTDVHCNNTSPSRIRKRGKN